MFPKEHLTGLHESVKEHERRIAELRDVIIPAIEEEIALHEALIELAQNEELITQVGRVQHDPDWNECLTRAPQQYLAEKGVRLPENVTLNTVHVDESMDRLTATLRVGSRNVEVLWEREGGFFARPLDPLGLVAWFPAGKSGRDDDIREDEAIRQRSPG